LSLQLLQNALILINTTMMDKVIIEEQFLSRMTKEDRRSVTPLFTSNTNPYGDVHFDFTKPSFLKAAA